MKRGSQNHQIVNREVRRDQYRRKSSAEYRSAKGTV